MVDQLILAAEAVVRYRIAIYRDRFKLTELQYRMMMHVARHAPISVGHLAALVDRDVAQVSRTVKLLVDSGLLTTRRTPGGVAKSLDLSAEGHAIHDQMATIGEEWEGAISDAMPLEEIAHATQAMEQLYAAASRILDRDDLPACHTRRDRRRAAVARA